VQEAHAIVLYNLVVALGLAGGEPDLGLARALVRIGSRRRIVPSGCSTVVKSSLASSVTVIMRSPVRGLYCVP
jgi:hypothetical protein